VAFLLGLIAGNSNLGESAFAIVALFLLVVAKVRDTKSFDKIGIEFNRNFYSLFVGTVIGTIGIAAAPGFWLRASDQVGLPSSPAEFLFRFARSFASFTADALTHPMMWVLFFLGVAYASRLSPDLSEKFALRLRVIAAASVLIWLALVLGSTFAYPSWHQSMGLYIFLFPTSFALGLSTKSQHLKRSAASLLVFSSLVMFLTFVRIGVLGVSRSLEWDRNLTHNICALEGNPGAELRGAEIRYPPFGLGVEDVNTWKWMREKYVGWIGAIPDSIKCK
jgi:hypothetical protein